MSTILKRRSCRGVGASRSGEEKEAEGKLRPAALAEPGSLVLGAGGDPDAAGAVPVLFPGRRLHPGYRVHEDQIGCNSAVRGARRPRCCRRLRSTQPPGRILATVSPRLYWGGIRHHLAIPYILDVSDDLSTLDRKNEARRLFIYCEEPHLVLNRLLGSRQSHWRHPFSARIWSIASSIGVQSFGSDCKVYGVPRSAVTASKAPSCRMSTASALRTTMYCA